MAKKRFRNYSRSPRLESLLRMGCEITYSSGYSIRLERIPNSTKSKIVGKANLFENISYALDEVISKEVLRHGLTLVQSNRKMWESQEKVNIRETTKRIEKS